MQIWATGGQIGADLGDRRPDWYIKVRQEVKLVQIWSIGGHMCADLGNRRPDWYRSGRHEVRWVQIRVTEGRMMGAGNFRWKDEPPL